MKRSITWVVSTLAAEAVLALLVLGFGLVPVSADVAPPRLETNLMGMALRASVARHASTPPITAPPSDENLIAGVRIYRDMCARCHGRTAVRPATLGASLYPPAPPLRGRRTGYTEAEVFWIVKRGIRNTGMPAFGRLLSDGDIAQLAALIERSDALPAGVDSEWK
ncbi:MAG TPA: cytochrome c [Thermoanaerobaculia bacterium]|nr:cytochrome c [Thermoanaerobaculia bacterium]